MEKTFKFVESFILIKKNEKQKICLNKSDLEFVEPRQ